MVTCHYHVFLECRKCGTSKPSNNTNQPAINTYSFHAPGDNEGVASNNNTASQVVPSTTFKPGDWNCNCGALNFASRAACYKCAAPKHDMNNNNNANH